MNWKKYIPQVSKAKVVNEEIQKYIFGNCANYVKPIIIQYGFSGSMAKPYSSFSIYIWKVRITWWNNPFEKIITWWKHLKMDWTNWRDPDGERCPECGSARLRDSHGMAYEPVVFCKSCGSLVWEPEDITPYII